MFKLGETDASNYETYWANEIAAAPAPWGEIGSDKIVISAPRADLEKIRNPDTKLTYGDPEKVFTEYWDKVS